jgi:hypothetical protein
MGRRDKFKFRPMTVIDLARAAHSNPSANTALDRYIDINRQLEGDWRKPAIEYSDFNGYRVIDPRKG